MGHKYSLILSRQISDDELSVLGELGLGEALFSTTSLPTNADVTVTKIEVDDTVSTSLADAIEMGLEAVKKVPDLVAAGLTVPAVPKEAADGAAESAVKAGGAIEGSPVA
ncbi:hypothetical protein [Actinomadura sp. WAC 06369]|uniref:hypothetical protein n=1 Tax=Actinomadura sp. WAC 06369 TaxID=2203193 RepID=UPI000F7A8396|nr:hypothetical protein [Actinomadura sp. WAC 06369]RSN53258.1 hypothetical protein DMH08_27875 [Actinomadura sp. WAC 06369]